MLLRLEDSLKKEDILDTCSFLETCWTLATPLFPPFQIDVWSWLWIRFRIWISLIPFPIPPHHLLRGKTPRTSSSFCSSFYKVIPTIMVLIEVGSVMMLTSSQTSSSWMLSVLSNTTVSGRDVPSVLTSLRESGRHPDQREGSGWGLDGESTWTRLSLMFSIWLNWINSLANLAEERLTLVLRWCEQEVAAKEEVLRQKSTPGCLA